MIKKQLVQSQPRMNECLCCRDATFNEVLKHGRQRQFVKKPPLSIKYTHYVNSSKGVWLLHSRGMQFIQGSNRNQTYFATLEEQVSIDNPVRPMDAFID